MELLNTVCGLVSYDRNKSWILDAGCGSGGASCAARLLGFNVQAFDQSETAVEIAKHRLIVKSHLDIWADAYKEIVGQKERKLVDTCVKAAIQPALVQNENAVTGKSPPSTSKSRATPRKQLAITPTDDL